MAMKKSAQTVREELRVLNAAADDVASSNMNEWLTPEFWATAATVVTNMVAVGVLLGWVRASEAETLTTVLTGLVSATSAIVTNGLVIWKFIASRTAVKESMIDARFRYMEAIAVEKIRAEKE
jgi:hypothetical protein